MSLLSASQPTRPAAQTSGEEAVETTVDTPSSFRGSGYRRPAPTHYAPKPGVRVEVRPWGGGAGQDVALEFIDLSELGVRVRLRLAVRVSDRFEVTVRNTDGRRWIKGMASIASSERDASGTVVALLTFSQSLLPHVVRQLGGEPVPVPGPVATEAASSAGPVVSKRA